MLYDKARELADESLKRWLSEELFSAGWFAIAGVLAAAYIVWFILLDKRRAVQLLLLGSLAAVAYTYLSMVISDHFGLVEYKVRLTPTVLPLLISSVTLTPITLMFAQQYSSSWKGYLLWSAAGIAFLCFVLFPIYTRVGILQWHRGWNYLYHFLVMNVVSIGTRLVFLWIVGTQKRHMRESG